MKVIIITISRRLAEEQYFGVASSIKNAEKLIRSTYPHMRKIDSFNGDHVYSSDRDNTYFLYLKEETVF